MQTFDPVQFHITPLQVPLFEIDLGQAVYHGNYYHFYNQARDAFLREAGFPYKRLMELERHLAIVELNTRFRQSLRYDDEIEVETGVSWWRSRSIGMVQRIHRLEENGERSLCNEATFSMVCVDFSGRAVILPEQLLERLQGWISTNGGKN